MSNEIILLIKRNNLELFYCQNKSEYRSYKPDGANEIPMYFFSDGSSFQIGKNAKTKFDNKNKEAYSNYFELIKKVDKQFKFIGGVKQPIKNIFIRGVEFLINEFLKNILYSSKNVYEIKNNLKFNLVFHNDVNENEIDFLSNLFIEEGFTNTKTFYFNYLVLNYLDLNRKIGRFKGYITVDSINNNLNLSYYDSLKRNHSKFFDIGKNLATRPEINIIANLLCEVAIDKSGSLVDKDKEIPFLLQTSELALKKLESRREIYIEVNLSDGSNAKVKLKKSVIDEKTQYQTQFSQDLSFLQKFSKKTHLQQTDFIVILNSSVNNQFFIDKVRSTFPHDHSLDVEFYEILELFIKNHEIIENGNLIGSKSKKSIKSEKSVQNRSSNPEIKTTTKTIPSNIGDNSSKGRKSPPPQPPPITSVRSRKRNKNIPPPPKIVKSSNSSSLEKNKPISPLPPVLKKVSSDKEKLNKQTKRKPPPPPPPLNISARNNKKPPPPLGSPPLPKLKKKTGPPPLPKLKKKTGPPPLPGKK